MFDLRRSTFDVERSAFDVSTVHVPIACAFLGRILPLHERPARSPTPSRGITDVAASVRSPPTRSRGPRAAPLTLAALTPGPGSPPPAAAELDAAELDQSIRDVIRRHEYSWRLPREGAPEEENDASKSALVRFLESIGRGLDAGLTAIGRWIRDLVNWLRIGQWGPSGGGGPGYDWFSPLRFLLILLIAALAVLLAVLLHRAWKNRQPTPLDAESAAPLPGRPDLADESIGADQLPDDQWLALARDLAARGDLRLALRAFYLASLAHLAGRNLIALARFKSNLEYQRELDRRAHALPGLVPLFHHNVSVFDRVWYGRHEVTPEGVQEFAANVEKIRRQDHEHSHP